MSHGGANEKAQALLATLMEGLTDYLASDKYLEWLDVQSRFHRYSFNNTMLIMMQRPGATQVAGYRKWQEVGRQVRRGEQGISIFAPIIVKQVEERDGRESEREALVGFKVVRVFDVSQTDGPPLPSLGHQDLTGNGEAARNLTPKLHALAAGLGLRVTESAEIAPRGTFDVQERAIALRAGLSADQHAKTFAHEIAHSLLHGRWDEDRVSREQAEVEAESVAYIVCRAAGLDTDEHSFSYIAGWSWGSPEILAAAGQRVQRTAAYILNSINRVDREAVA